jgi:predicted phosphodiesterase
MSPPNVPPLRRFALIGDVHAQVDALETVLLFARMRGAERAFSVGDLSDGDGDLDRTVALLVAHDVGCVRGNHDRWLLEGRLRDLRFAHQADALRPATLEFLRALPVTRALETACGVALLCHGVGVEDMPVVVPATPARDVLAMPAFAAVCALDRIAMMLCGHTHARMVRAIGPLTLINPGTLAPGDDPGFVLIDAEARTVEAFDIDEDFAIRAAGTSRFGLAGQDVWGFGF